MVQICVRVRASVCIHEGEEYVCDFIIPSLALDCVNVRACVL